MSRIDIVKADRIMKIMIEMLDTIQAKYLTLNCHTGHAEYPTINISLKIDNKNNLNIPADLDGHTKKFFCMSTQTF